ncbi:hypothetical protein ABT010_39090, partial [Streptomyces sp. NPDC002668]|uniref:hypothetical protein n=1 Tax=Streptomyces sp. NPDC002668 TaxID=3154422 RepID=UPI003329F4E8
MDQSHYCSIKPPAVLTAETPTAGRSYCPGSQRLDQGGKMRDVNIEQAVAKIGNVQDVPHLPMAWRWS